MFVKGAGVRDRSGDAVLHYTLLATRALVHGNGQQLELPLIHAAPPG